MPWSEEREILNSNRVTAIQEFMPGACFSTHDGTLWRILAIDEEARDVFVIARHFLNKEFLCRDLLSDLKPEDSYEEAEAEWLKSVDKLLHMPGMLDDGWSAGPPPCTSDFKKLYTPRCLNRDYYEDSFTQVEKAAILETELALPDDADPRGAHFPSVKRKIFLPSWEEIERYYARNTNFMIHNHGYSWAYFFWILRNTDRDLSIENDPARVRVLCVMDSGEDYGGDTVSPGCNSISLGLVSKTKLDRDGNSSYYRFRPACRFDLDSAFFCSLLGVDDSGRRTISCVLTEAEAKEWICDCVPVLNWQGLSEQQARDFFLTAKRRFSFGALKILRNTLPQMVVSEMLFPAEKKLSLYAEPGVLFASRAGIRWKILDMDEASGTALAVMAEGSFMHAFDQRPGPIHWADCNLRQVLNYDFYELYFTEEEKAAIITCELEEAADPEAEIHGGEKTRDKIFLLSAKEAKAHSKALASIVQHGGIDQCWCWLRSTGTMRFGEDTFVLTKDGELGVDSPARLGMVLPAFRFRPENFAFFASEAEEWVPDDIPELDKFLEE